MSECVVRMEMPDLCPCVFAEDNNGWYGPCFAYNGIPERDKEFYQCVENMKRPSWCPVICQLPEGHGRLVDADMVEKMLEDAQIISDGYGEYAGYCTEDVDMGIIPTIVPAGRSGPCL